MFKLFVFAAILAFAFAVPAPEPKPAPKPGLIATSYSAPLVNPVLSYSPYSAPLAYSGYSNYIAQPYYAAPYATNYFY